MSTASPVTTEQAAPLDTIHASAADVEKRLLAQKTQPFGPEGVALLTAKDPCPECASTLLGTQEIVKANNVHVTQLRCAKCGWRGEEVARPLAAAIDRLIRAWAPCNANDFDIMQERVQARADLEALFANATPTKQGATVPADDAADLDLAAAFNAAVNDEYPLPDNPHHSVVQRATDNRSAMWRGMNAARKILLALGRGPLGALQESAALDARKRQLLESLGYKFESYCDRGEIAWRWTEPRRASWETYSWKAPKTKLLTESAAIDSAWEDANILRPQLAAQVGEG